MAEVNYSGLQDLDIGLEADIKPYEPVNLDFSEPDPLEDLYNSDSFNYMNYFFSTFQLYCIAFG